MEGYSLNSVIRNGMRTNRELVGEQVKIAGPRSKTRSHHMRISNMLMADGTELLFTDAGPRWTVTDNTTEENLQPAPPGAEVAGVSGIYRVWTITGGRRVPLDGELPLTVSARNRQALFEPQVDDPLLACISPGMPPTMGNPYPMQFVKGDGEILLYLEEFDITRTIHLTGVEDVDQPPASPLGYSTGHWEGDTLVVVTKHINYPFFNRVGVPQSEEVRTTERFTPSSDRTRLDYQLEIVDPATFTETVTWSTHYSWLPGEEVKAYNCTLEG